MKHLLRPLVALAWLAIATAARADYKILKDGVLQGDLNANTNAVTNVARIVWSDSTTQTTAPPASVDLETWGRTSTVHAATNAQYATNAGMAASAGTAAAADAAAMAAALDFISCNGWELWTDCVEGQPMVGMHDDLNVTTNWLGVEVSGVGFTRTADGSRHPFQSDLSPPRDLAPGGVITSAVVAVMSTNWPAANWLRTEYIQCVTGWAAAAAMTTTGDLWLAKDALSWTNVRTGVLATNAGSGQMQIPAPYISLGPEFHADGTFDLKLDNNADEHIYLTCWQLLRPLDQESLKTDLVSRAVIGGLVSNIAIRQVTGQVTNSTQLLRSDSATTNTGIGGVSIQITTGRSFRAQTGAGYFAVDSGNNNTAPMAPLVNTNSNGKAVGMIAGTGGGGMVFDQAGTFAILHDSKSAISAGTSGYGTLDTTWYPGGALVHAGAISAGGAITGSVHVTAAPQLLLRATNGVELLQIGGTGLLFRSSSGTTSLIGWAISPWAGP